jgi:YbbR domain-containing protein
MMERLLKNNTIVKVVAFFLALTLWAYVAGDALRANIPEVTRHFRNVPLAWVNLDEGLAIVQIPAAVDVLLQGRSDLINQLTPESIQAYVNMQGLGEGQHRLSPGAQVPRGIRVISLTPQQVVVEVEQVESPQLQVSLDIAGTPAEGFVVGEPRIVPQTVFVTGTRSALARVDRVRAIASVDGANTDRVQIVPVVPVDANGREVENVSVSPAMVEVLIPLSEPHADVPVRVPLQGQPAEGFRVRQVNIDPAAVTILGPEAVLRAVTEVITETVDLTDIRETTVFTVSLLPPPENLRVTHTGPIRVEIIVEPE